MKEPLPSDRLCRIRLILMDCDGVLTDGRLYFTSAGEEMKVFNVRDGQGLASWHQAGHRSGIISGRGARAIIEKRAEELGVEFVRTASQDKTRDFFEILEAACIAPEETAYVGDDVGDVGIMKLVGIPVAVADAVKETKDAAAYVTRAAGGMGAIREVTDMLLEAKLVDGGATR